MADELADESNLHVLTLNCWYSSFSSFFHNNIYISVAFKSMRDVIFIYLILKKAIMKIVLTRLDYISSILKCTC